MSYPPKLIQIQLLLKLNCKECGEETTPHGHSNTTLVKVKFTDYINNQNNDVIQIQLLLKLN